MNPPPPLGVALIVATVAYLAACWILLRRLRQARARAASFEKQLLQKAAMLRRTDSVILYARRVATRLSDGEPIGKVGVKVAHDGLMRAIEEHDGLEAAQRIADAAGGA